MTDDSTKDMKGRLERLGERGPERSDAFERLRDARERRDRRRRRSALAVGLSVVVVGAVVVATTLRNDGAAPVPRDDDPVVEAWHAPETPYLWPENWARAEDRELLADAQAAADAGDDAVAWRLDPKEVVRRFLQTVLAWEEPYFVQEVDTPGAGRWWDVAPPCREGTTCDQDAHLRVGVSRPIPGGDVWSIVWVTSEALAVRSSEVFRPDPSLGPQVVFELTLPEGRSAHAGLVASNGCREASEFALALESGTSTLTVPAAEADDPSCGEIGAGYLFVYAMDDTTVPTGDPLLESAAIEYPWLTMMPVEVQMSAAPASSVEPAPVAIIECSGPGVAGTEVLTPVVAAQADGVHVEVRNTSEVDLGISFATRGDNADVGTTELVLDSPPGGEEALCTDTETDMSIAGAPFEIVDPEGYWVSTELEGETCSVMNVDHGEIPQGIADPIEAARDALGDRVEEGDGLVLVGYPEAAVEKVAVLRRGGVPIISVAMFEGTEGWFEHTVTTCG